MKFTAGRFCLLLAVFMYSCASQSRVQPYSPSSAFPTPPPVPNRPSGGGITDEIRALASEGSPSSLLKALDIIKTRDISAGEFGRMMNAVIGYILQRVYPDIKAQVSISDPPQTSAYTRILRGIDKEIYVAPSENADYIAYVLPFLVLLSSPDPARLSASLPDIEKAVSLNPKGALGWYFAGFIYEHTEKPDEAEKAYAETLAISPECYPASLGLARLMTRGQRYQDAVKTLSDALKIAPDNLTVKKQLALVYYAMEDWSRAESAILEILQRNSADREFQLLYVRILIEKAQFGRAQAQLDSYASTDSASAANPAYLFLRARIQAEGYRNNDAALNYLRALNSASSIDDDILVYTARLLLSSERNEEQSEGRAMLQTLLSRENPTLSVIDLALADAIRRKAWGEARPYLRRLIAERRSQGDLLNAYTVERGLNNSTAALSYAREAFQKDSANIDAAFAYISALIDARDVDEASRLIDARLNNAPSGAVKSKYYYLRSRLKTNEEARLNDLRSSLFEDPRNLNALLAMFDYYHKQNDRRALYYLKQALALTPDDPQLKRYEKEYF
jgi:tetratricopeptide (TPR) repeat protein